MFTINKMPFSKGYGGTRRKRYNARQSLARTVQQLINKNKETKRKIFTRSGGTVLSGSVITEELTDIPQGDGENQRLGDQALIRSMGGRYVISAGSTGGTSQVLRCVLYSAKKADNNLNSGSPGNLTTTSYIDPALFHVWFDKCWTLGNSSVSNTPENRVVYLGKKFYNKRIKGMKTHWADNSTTDVQKNALVLVWVSDQVTNGPTISGYTNVYFQD